MREQDMSNSSWGQDLENEIAAQLAEELRGEIDAQIIGSMLEQMGWHAVKVTVPPGTKLNVAGIVQWTDIYIEGTWYANGNSYYFERTEDAALFALKWK